METNQLVNKALVDTLVQVAAHAVMNHVSKERATLQGEQILLGYASEGSETQRLIKIRDDLRQQWSQAEDVVCSQIYSLVEKEEQETTSENN